MQLIELAQKLDAYLADGVPDDAEVLIVGCETHGLQTPICGVDAFPPDGGEEKFTVRIDVAETP
jgi:hypothetical protein